METFRLLSYSIICLQSGRNTVKVSRPRVGVLIWNSISCINPYEIYNLSFQFRKFLIKWPSAAFKHCRSYPYHVCNFLRGTFNYNISNKWQEEYLIESPPPCYMLPIIYYDKYAMYERNPLQNRSMHLACLQSEASFKFIFYLINSSSIINAYATLSTKIPIFCKFFKSNSKEINVKYSSSASGKLVNWKTWRKFSCFKRSRFIKVFPFIIAKFIPILNST